MRAHLWTAEEFLGDFGFPSRTVGNRCCAEIELKLKT